jgi:hypothetical protein
MSAAQRQLNPSEFTDEQCQMMALALLPHLNRFGIEERPMRQDKVAEFLDCTEKTIIALRNKGVIKAHRFEADATPYYYPSEINRALKNSKH